MTWALSHYRKGDWVEVRSSDEILATLDARGRAADGMPFMPEMLQYCGKRFQVGAVAHKSCDMVGKIGTSRRLQTTVHLQGLRCDGSAHGGCQAECYLYWKDEWLKPSGQPQSARTLPAAAGKGLSEAELLAATRKPAPTADEDRLYACQATEVYEASRFLPWWDARQYLYDITTRNHSFGHTCAIIFLAILRWAEPRVPFGYNFLRNLSERAHHRLTGRGRPALAGQIPDGAPSPTGTLALQEGEYVRIRPQAEIETTLNRHGRNRGLSFDGEEMAPYCGKVVRVRRRVTRIVEEATGRMIEMKQPCIMLDGVICDALYASCRLNCPRAIPSYWREIWLERAPPGDVPDNRQAAATSLSGGPRPPA